MSKKEILAWIYYNGLLEITIDHLGTDTLRNCAILASEGILAGYHYLTHGNYVFVLRENDPIY